MARLLIVEDDRAVRQSLVRAFEVDRHEVIAIEDGRTVVAEMLRGPGFDAVVLDVGLPGMDGLQVCRRLRGAGDRTPVLMLTARDAVDDRVVGLEAGADDYLVKPFALRELKARLRALIRRSEPPSPSAPPLSYADLTIDLIGQEAFRGGRRIELTRTELMLLRFFVEHPEKALTRSQLFEGVWGYDFGPASNALGVYVGYLRRKTELGGEPRLLHTVRGVGYILKASRVGG